jgi:uncharacterized RmlC-like cupin family protein
MQKIALAPSFIDTRGTITDLLNDVPIASVGIVTSHTGAVRGNKYQRSADKYIYVIKGRVEWVSRRHGDDGAKTTVFSTGDFFLVPAMMEHAMRFLEDTDLLELTTKSRARNDYEDDTVRLETPLIAEVS